MNRYSKLLNGGNLFTVIINNKYCLCTKNSKGKIITLKKNLNYWDVMSYAYNRSIKKKIKKHKYLYCTCCGINGKDIKSRLNVLTLELYGKHEYIVTCLSCYKKISADI